MKIRGPETNCRRLDSTPGIRKHEATEFCNYAHRRSALFCSRFLAQCRPQGTNICSRLENRTTSTETTIQRGRNYRIAYRIEHIQIEGYVAKKANKKVFRPIRYAAVPWNAIPRISIGSVSFFKQRDSQKQHSKPITPQDIKKGSQLRVRSGTKTENENP